MWLLRVCARNVTFASTHRKTHTHTHSKKNQNPTAGLFSPEEHFRVLRQKDPERPKAEVLGVFPLPTCYFGNHLKFSLCLE